MWIGLRTRAADLYPFTSRSVSRLIVALACVLAATLVAGAALVAEQ